MYVIVKQNQIVFRNISLLLTRMHLNLEHMLLEVHVTTVIQTLIESLFCPMDNNQYINLLSFRL